MIESPADDHAGRARNEFLSFEVAGQSFCIDILAVRELRGWTEPTPLPRSPSYMRGVVNLRGTVLPVLDTAARLGMAAQQPTARHVIVVVAVGGQTLGLLVDRVCEIVVLADDALQAAPDIRSDAEGFVTALVTSEDRMMGLLALDRLAPGDEAQAA
jgi:purine-binding chemotaxis protein CheW